MGGQPQPLGSGFKSDANLRASGGQGQNRFQDPATVPLPNTVDVSELPLDEIEALRSREITAKAVSGILLMLLKWFKVSRTFCLEHMKQFLTPCRHSEIRVFHSASARLELSSAGVEAVCSPRD